MIFSKARKLPIRILTLKSSIRGDAQRDDVMRKCDVVTMCFVSLLQCSNALRLGDMAISLLTVLPQDQQLQ